MTRHPVLLSGGSFAFRRAAPVPIDLHDTGYGRAAASVRWARRARDNPGGAPL